MQGTTDWTWYSLTLPVNYQATQLQLGIILGGTGTEWADDLELLVDGQPVGDHEFDNGSGIAITSLSDIQIRNLAKLAKVWGFLKYHHPAVTSGQHQWDYDLFRVLPAVLAAADGQTANQAIADWITVRLGTVTPCTTCATLDTSNLYMGTSLDWIYDASLLGAGLSQTLQSIYVNRTAATDNIFLYLYPGVGTPMFRNESTYAGVSLPDSGYQLLALFRFWNMVQYFYPNRDVMANDPAGSPNYWDDVLQASILEFALAQSSLDYQQALLRLIAKINDTHAHGSNLTAARPPIGTCQLPVQVRFVEGSPVVAGYHSSDGASSGLQIGDVIEQLDGVAVADLVEEWTPYYAASNEAARLRDIGRAMTQGDCGPASVSVLRGRKRFRLTADRVLTSALDLAPNLRHDRPGDAFQMLSSHVAYIKIGTAQAAQAANYIQSASGTKGLIIDIRDYPSDSLLFSLGDLLVSEPVNFVQFTEGDVTNPGAFHWTASVGLTPAQPHYTGKVVILVDEITQSSAEYHAMAFRTAPGAVVVGSTTAGADGNVLTIPFPGGFYCWFSGIGVFYPNHTPTQRIGIVPDIVVTPTIKGIRAGQDEVLNAAICLIQGKRPANPINR